MNLLKGAVLLVCLLVGVGALIEHEHEKPIQVQQVKNNAISTRRMQNDKEKRKGFGSQVCAKVCTFWSCTTYYCVDGVCCTPGSPQSLCCPDTHPLCLAGGCCPKYYPKICRIYCCHYDAKCCTDSDKCCGNSQTCCGSTCCDEGTNCCTQGDQDVCCRYGTSCCGTNCCDDENEKCCTKTLEGDVTEKSCCNAVTMACCEGDIGCVEPCTCPFEALGCQPVSTPVQDVELPYPCLDYNTTGLLYRIMRRDESCRDSLKPKDPSNRHNKKILTHVNCGSRKNLRYGTPWISTSTTPKSPSMKKFIGQARQQRLNIAIISIPQDLGNCYVDADLTKEEERDKYLGRAVCKRFAAASCEVLIRCGVGDTVSCKQVPARDFVMEDEEMNRIKMEMFEVKTRSKLKEFKIM